MGREAFLLSSWILPQRNGAGSLRPRATAAVDAARRPHQEAPTSCPLSTRRGLHPLDAEYIQHGILLVHSQSANDSCGDSGAKKRTP